MFIITYVGLVLLGLVIAACLLWEFAKIIAPILIFCGIVFIIKFIIFRIKKK